MRRFEKYLKNRPASLLHGTAPGRKWSRLCILLEGGVPMKEIAGLVGYGDVYAFSKQFSRFFDSHLESTAHVFTRMRRI